MDYENIHSFENYSGNLKIINAQVDDFFSGNFSKLNFYVKEFDPKTGFGEIHIKNSSGVLKDCSFDYMECEMYFTNCNFQVDNQCYFGMGGFTNCNLSNINVDNCYCSIGFDNCKIDNLDDIYERYISGEDIIGNKSFLGGGIEFTNCTGKSGKKLSFMIKNRN